MELARELFKTMGTPSEQDFVAMLEQNSMKKCHMSPQDAENALKIFSPEVGALKGDCMRQSLDKMVDTDIMPVPKMALKNNKVVTLTGDLMFVNSLQIMITFLRNIRCTTVDPVNNRSVNSQFHFLKKTVIFCTSCRFHIKLLLMDLGFKKLRDLLGTLKMTLNITSAQDHTLETEQRIGVVKEWVRAERAMLPFKNVPNLMVLHLLNFVALRMNTFPSKSGVSNKITPRMLVAEQLADGKKDCKSKHDDCAQTHKNEVPGDSTKIPRTTGDICMGPVANFQGDCKFMSLTTGRRLTQCKWTPVPMPDNVIKRVEEMAQEEQVNLAIVFCNRNCDDVWMHH